MKDQAGLKTRQTEKVYLQREYVMRVRKYVIHGTEPEETKSGTGRKAAPERAPAPAGSAA